MAEINAEIPMRLCFNQEYYYNYYKSQTISVKLTSASESLSPPPWAEQKSLGGFCYRNEKLSIKNSLISTMVLNKRAKSEPFTI